MTELYGTEYNLAPRLHVSSSGVGKTADSLATDGFVYFLDIQREAEINVGVDWPYPDLKAGECVLTKDYQSANGLSVGDEIYVNMQNQALWVTLASFYNQFYKAADAP